MIYIILLMAYLFVLYPITALYKACYISRLLHSLTHSTHFKEDVTVFICSVSHCNCALSQCACCATELQYSVSSCSARSAWHQGGVWGCDVSWLLSGQPGIHLRTHSAWHVLPFLGWICLVIVVHSVCSIIDSRVALGIRNWQLLAW